MIASTFTKMFFSILLPLLGLCIPIESNDEDYLRRDKRIIRVQNNFNYTKPVKYYIDTNINNKKNILEALNHLEHYTCLKFTEVKQTLKKDGINFYKKPDLSVEYKYYKDKLSNVSITLQCLKELGCMKHMIGRAFGLHFETARYDRNHYVKILWNNIEQQSKKLYSKVKGFKSRYFNTAFDYGSIMMPNITEGAMKGKKAYTTKGSKLYENMVGQREEFSFSDIKKINDVFCGGQCGKKLRNCKNGGYPSPNCGICNCPSGYKGKYCEKLEASQGDCGKRFLYAKRREQTLTLKGLKKCVIGFYSKPRTNLALVVKKVKTTKRTPCVENKGIEIKYRHDKGATGLVLCGSYKDVVIKPTFSRAVMIYLGQNKDDMITLSYREVRRTSRK
uniref:Metalloendopeptidase n=1 Tax=Strongyloides papillosus TaxID=174720 RepID=A0A0N5BZD6_STREA